jgi:hypothetical protein
MWLETKSRMEGEDGVVLRLEMRRLRINKVGIEEGMDQGGWAWEMGIGKWDVGRRMGIWVVFWRRGTGLEVRMEEVRME